MSMLSLGPSLTQRPTRRTIDARRLTFGAAFCIAAALSSAACRDLTAPSESTRLAIDLDTAQAGDPYAADFSGEASLPARIATLNNQFEAAPAQYLKGVSSVSLHYKVFEVASEKGAIVLLPGRSEPIAKYAEVIADLKSQGYSVYALDHRGQGASGRMLTNSYIGYVKDFQDYVADLHTFVTSVVLSKPHANVFMLAHSMGGAVSQLYLDQHPGIFKAAALTAPMIEPDTGKYPPSVANSLTFSSCSRNGGAGYALGQTDPNFDLAFSSPDNDVTQSVARFDAKMALYRAHPNWTLGGVSYRWLCATTLATSHLKTIGGGLRVPTLMLQAEKDTVVRNSAQNRYCGDSTRCMKIAMPDSRHEILMERDAIRNSALTKITRFFNHYVRTAPLPTTSLNP